MALEDHPELKDRLGREPDRELAETYDVSMSTIRTWRKHAGCSEAPRSPTRTAPPDPDERLGTVPDRVLAAERGVTHQAIAYRRQARGIPPYRPDPEERLAEVLGQLGEVSDARLARTAGTCPGVVGRARRARGIPVAPIVERDIPYEYLLGTMSDAKIAKLYGITRLAVFTARKRRGIPCMRKQKNL
jgi:transposase-like protein